jgi:Ca-activated chloride channel family protein
MFRIEHTEWLWGIFILLPLLFLFLRVLRWKKKVKTSLGDEALVNELIKDYSPFRFNIKFIIALLSVALLMLALSNPQQQTAGEKVEKTGVDVMIVMDLSKSMLARDLQPNRLERAKQLVMRLLDKMENDRVGLIFFAGHSYLQMPLTTDFSAAAVYLSAASPDAIPTQGTVITEALNMAGASFNTKENKFKSIVLITDGEDHHEGAVAAAKALSEEGVQIHTVGVGTVSGSAIFDPLTGANKTDENGNEVISKLNEDELKQIAKAANGHYILLNNAEEAAAKIIDSLNGMEQRKLIDKSLANWQSFFPYILAMSLLLLVAASLMAERKKSKA